MPSFFSITRQCSCILGSSAKRIVAPRNTTCKSSSGSSLHPQQCSKENSKRRLKSGEKATNRWTQLLWQTPCQVCVVKRECSHSPQSHPSVLPLTCTEKWLLSVNWKQLVSENIVIICHFFNIAPRLYINFKYIKMILAWGFDLQQSHHQHWHLWLITTCNVHVINVWKQGNNKFSTAPSGARTFHYISYYGPSLLIA